MKRKPTKAKPIDLDKDGIPDSKEPGLKAIEKGKKLPFGGKQAQPFGKKKR